MGSRRCDYRDLLRPHAPVHAPTPWFHAWRRGDQMDIAILLLQRGADASKAHQWLTAHNFPKGITLLHTLQRRLRLQQRCHGVGAGTCPEGEDLQETERKT